MRLKLRSAANKDHTARRFRAVLLIDRYMTLSNYDFQSGTYRLALSKPLPGELTVSAIAGYSEEFSHVRPDGTIVGFLDTGLSLTRALGEIGSDQKLLVRLNLVLPKARFEGGLGGGSTGLTYFTRMVSFVTGNGPGKPVEPFG
jgi:hypothetical protein